MPGSPSSQYVANEYQALFKQHGLLCSMSGKGDCYDNAAMESFFHSLKIERIYGMVYATRVLAKQDVFGYMEIYYHRRPPPSALDLELLEPITVRGPVPSCVRWVSMEEGKINGQL